MTDPEARLAAARKKLEKAGRDWHKAAGHPGAYSACDEKSCYHTHEKVSR